MPEWTPEAAEAMARELGIGLLTAEHWTLIAHCREDAARRGFAPCPKRLAELSGLSEARIGHLFPGNPGSLVTRIAGLPERTGRRHPGEPPRLN